MPIYEFKCMACKKEFEELLLNTREKVKCPVCNSKRIKRLLSMTAFKSGSKFTSTASNCSGCSSKSCAGCH